MSHTPNPPDPAPTTPVLASRPRPMASLISSARRLTSRDVHGRTRGGSAIPKQSWQEDAWDMYDLVGEERFLASTLANRLSQAHLYVGKLADDPTEKPIVVEDDAVQRILTSIGTSPAGRAQMIQRLGLNLFIAGDGWLAGIPSALMPESLRMKDIRPEYSPGDLTIDDLEWRMLSVSEVAASVSSGLVLTLGESEDEQLTIDPDDIYLIRVWRPHPRKWWEADSPTRSSLPVLRELVGLTMHISAQVDSRLAGAGLLVVPQGAQAALKAASGMDVDSEEDVFTDALMEAMLTPISDRGNASALVPLVVTVPDDLTDKFEFLSFATPLDAEARSLRDEAIRRLALGQDAPPELLLGVGGMNHWGAWLVREEVVTTHLEPPLALICDAITTQFLWPILEGMGYEGDALHELVVWYDVDHMIMRPNRSADAMVLYDKGVLSDGSLRDATGFDESDAPETSKLEDPAYIVLDMVRQAPSLTQDPGITELMRQVTALMAGEAIDPAPVIDTAPVEDEEEDAGDDDESTPEPTGEIPTTEDDAMELPEEEA